MPTSILVFDSNVLIPLILTASRSTRLFYRLDAAGWQLAATPQLLAEVEDKLRSRQSLRAWLKTTDDDIDDTLGKMIVTLHPWQLPFVLVSAWVNHRQQPIEFPREGTSAPVRRATAAFWR